MTTRSIFAFGAESWPGIAKLVEEAGEVIQVCGKLMMTYGRKDHWDGSDLVNRLEDELGDLEAAISFVIQNNPLNRLRVRGRQAEKFDRFSEWHRKGLGVDELDDSSAETGQQFLDQERASGGGLTAAEVVDCIKRAIQDRNLDEPGARALIEQYVQEQTRRLVDERDGLLAKMSREGGPAQATDPHRGPMSAGQLVESLWNPAHRDWVAAIKLVKQYALENAGPLYEGMKDECERLRVSLAGSEGAVRANGTTIDNLRAERDKLKGELEALSKDYGNLVKEHAEELDRVKTLAQSRWEFRAQTIAKSKIDSALKRALARDTQMLVVASQRLLCNIEDSPSELPTLCQHEDGNENECGQPRPCPKHDLRIGGG